MSPMSTTHLVIPDTQINADSPDDHCRWAGLLALEYEVDTIVHIGDHWDLASISTYNTRKEQEGMRFNRDLLAGNDALKLISEPYAIADKKAKKNNHRKKFPRRVFIHGNHEHRLNKWVADNPHMAQVVGPHQFNLDIEGWEHYPFLVPVDIDGIRYCHFFPRNAKGEVTQGRNGAPSAEAQVRREMISCTAGHKQGFSYAHHQTGSGIYHGLIAGSSYIQDFNYLTGHGVNYWRGLILKHAVNEGQYDLEMISLHRLCRKYEQTSLTKFVKDKYDLDIKYGIEK